MTLSKTLLCSTSLALLAVASAPLGAQTPPLLWPLRAPGLTDPGYHAIGGYVDHDLRPGRVQDYSCGGRTFDGHRGTDFNLAPYPWQKMDADAVEVVAVAAGEITQKQDGLDDRSCRRDDSAESNLIEIEHDDGSTALYLHFKRGSLTAKSVGDRVAAGERLGVIGSSGSSTLPHLHLELYDSDNNLLDPYAGSCNAFNDASLWREQRSYDDTAVNKLTTHRAPPEFKPCPQQAVTNAADQFEAGERVYFLAHYRGRSRQSSQNVVYRPDGSVHRQWSNAGSGYQPDSFQFRFFSLPGDAPSGFWRYRVIYEGETYEHRFSVGEVSGGDALIYRSQFEQ